MTEHICSVLGKINTEQFVTKDSAMHVGWITSQETPKTNKRMCMKTACAESMETQERHPEIGLHLHTRASFQCVLSPAL